MKILKANDGPLTNFEVLDYLRSRGVSKEVAVTVAASEYKVFQYLVETPAYSQTRENVTNFVRNVKKYDLSKAEVINLINIRPSLPVGIYLMVEKCDARLGETIAEQLAEAVTECLPPPPAQPENQDVQESDALAGGDPEGNDEPDEPEPEAVRENLGDIDEKAEDDNLMGVS
ncbi:hypothetical protein SAY87_028236 [Trapa incisa]|uniref:DNA-directed RNA polymerase III subunit RPC9 n=1 Tax=Trapa incisa TaxID=236973 RepID=A0AAN7KTM2_9MYRT|nr:hypothetical protein SAY87_028236 [Trapa incisa]